MSTMHRVSSVFVAAIIAAACETTRSPLAPAGTGEGQGASAEWLDGGVLAKSESVTLCHTTGNGRYRLLSINGAAEAAHRAHGDAAVGEAVPGQPGMVFDANCTARQATTATVITSGTWIAGQLQDPSPARFTIQGLDLLATGTWNTASSFNVCNGCVPGQTFSPRLVYENPTPMTDISFARGSATVAGPTYSFVEFGGRLVFEAEPMTIHSAPAGGSLEPVTVTTPFVLTGNLIGFEVLGRSDPLLVFDVPVSGRGTATLELVPHIGPTLPFLRLVFTFQDAR